MTLGRIGLVGLMAASALLFTSCAGMHKPPSNAKVEAARKRLSTAVEKAQGTAQKATATAARAQERVNAAQKAADQEAAASATVLTQLADLKKVAPPELQGRITALEGSVNEQQTAAAEVVVNLQGAHGEQAQLAIEHETLGKELFEATSAKIDLEKETRSYYGNVATLTAKLNEVEKQLLREKVISILWKVGGGIFVVLIIAVIVLFALGKLGWALGKIGIKAAI